MVGTIGNQERQGRESLEDGSVGLGASKTLEQFLEHESRGEDRLSRPKCLAQADDCRLAATGIAAQGQGRGCVR